MAELESPAPARRVLITGVTNPLARQLAEELLLDGAVEFVAGVDTVEEPYYFRDLDRSRFLYKRANIYKSRELGNLFLSEDFRAARINTVVHASFAPPLTGLQVPIATPLSTNVQGTKQLLERCIESPDIRRFIFLSSFLVYQVRPGSGTYLDETADLNFDADAERPIQDRVDADMLCRTWFESDKLDIAVLRPAPIIGRNIDGPLNLYLDAPFCPVPMGFDPIVNPIHARDVVRALQLLVHRDVKGVFNVAGKEMAPLSFFIRMAGATRVPIPASTVRPSARLLRFIRASRFDHTFGGCLLRYPCLLDTRKARELLGFEPNFHIKF